MRLSVLACAFLVVLGSFGFGQVCGANEVLLKNDSLPDVPSGATPVSVIAGLCENEAMGAAFDVSAIGSVVQLKSASAGFFQAAGAGGVQAIVNIVVFDDATFNGANVTMGNQLFDFAAQTGANIQISTHAINTVDLAQFNITSTTGKFVVTWTMLINGDPSGSCAGGYFANFGTDNDGSNPFVCSTTPQQNVLFILGQGWRDPAFAVVGGFPLCPLFFNGDGVFRCCVEDVTPTNPRTIAFFPSDQYQTGFPLLVQFTVPPSDAGGLLVPVIAGQMGSTPIPGTGLALPVSHDPLCAAYFNDPNTKSAFDLTPPASNYVGIIPPSGTSTGIVSIPAVNLPFPVPIYFTFVVVQGGTFLGVADLATLTLIPMP